MMPSKKLIDTLNSILDSLQLDPWSLNSELELKCGDVLSHMCNYHNMRLGKEGKKRYKGLFHLDFHIGKFHRYCTN